MRRFLIVTATFTAALLPAGTAVAATPVTNPHTASPTTQHAPAAVRRVRSSSASTAVTVTWTNPRTADFARTLVRLAAGAHAPGPHAGRRVALVPGFRHRTSIGHLQPGTVYTAALFASDAHGHLARPATIRVVTAPSPVRHVRTFDGPNATTVVWKNPSTPTFRHAVLSYHRGPVAPATPGDGTRVPLGDPKATSAALTGLAHNTPYSVTVWAVDAAGRRADPRRGTFTTDARPASDGVYTGRVVDTAGHPLLGVQVALDDFEESGPIHTTTTDANGRYTLSVPAGSYFVEIGGGDITGGTSDATGYQGTYDFRDVRAGATRHAGTSTLRPGAAVRVTVTDQQGDPLVGVQAYAAPVQPYVQSYSSGAFFFLTGAGGGALTGSDGTATIKGLPNTDALRVCTDTTAGPVTGGAAGVLGYAATCAARTVVPRLGRITGVPALALQTAPGASLSGRLRAPDGTGFAGSDIEIDQISGYHDAYTTTGTDGRYDVAGLVPGTYRVCAEFGSFLDAGSTGYSAGCSAPVTVGTTQPATGNLTLRPGAAATGKVLGPDGRPLADVQVYASHGYVGNLGTTDSTGHYTVKGLAPGPNSVCFDPGNVESSHRLPTGARSACERPRVELRRTRIRSGIDARLHAAGAVRGVVTGAASAFYVDVELEPLDHFGESYEAQQTSGGHRVRYIAADVPAGRYRVCAYTFALNGNGTQRCHHGAVVVRTGRTTYGAGVALPPTSTIRVVADDTSGHPVAGVDAVALRACRGGCATTPLFPGKTGVTVMATGSTDSKGRVTLDGLPAGQYAVCLFAYDGAVAGGAPAAGYADRCSGSSFDLDVTPGTTLTSTQTVTPGAVVAGRVTDTSGRPLRGVVVHVTGSAADDVPDDGFFDDPSQPLQGPAADSVTAADGTFVIRGVQAGDQTVCFDAAGARGGSSPGGYADQCFGGRVGSTHRGTTVTLVAGRTRNGVDQSLTDAAGLAGRIVGPTGRGISDAYVFIADAAGNSISAVRPGTHGGYRFTRLKTGTYKVCVDTYHYSGQCYRNVAWNDRKQKPPLARATPVQLTAGTLTPSIDFTLTG